MAQKIKLLYTAGGNAPVQIVQVTDGLYYYGNGKDTNSFSWNPIQWLRFDPYFPPAKPGDAIAESVLFFIGKNADAAYRRIMEKSKRNAELAEDPELIGHSYVWMDAGGNEIED